MKAMILAAGLGERLRPLTDRIPKALVQVAGRPMIEYPLLLLRAAGIREIIVNVHYLGEQIESYLGDGSAFGLSIQYSREEQLLDTGGALLKAKPLLTDGTFIVINADVLIDLPLQELRSFHLRHNGIATLVLRPDKKAEEYGALECSEDGRVRRFLNVRADNHGPVTLQKRMFTGVQIVEPTIFAYMKEGCPFSLTRTTYSRIVGESKPLYGFDYHGFWQDLGSVERIKQAEEKLARGEVKLRFLTE